MKLQSPHLLSEGLPFASLPSWDTASPAHWYQQPETHAFQVYEAFKHTLNYICCLVRCEGKPVCVYEEFPLICPSETPCLRWQGAHEGSRVLPRRAGPGGQCGAGVTRHLSAGIPTISTGAWVVARLLLEDTG